MSLPLLYLDSLVPLKKKSKGQWTADFHYTDASDPVNLLSGRLHIW